MRIFEECFGGFPKRRLRWTTLSLGLVLAMVALGLFFGELGAFGQEKAGRAKGPVFEVQSVAQGLDLPWGIDFLPGGDALVTERDSGRLLRVSPSGEVETVQRISEADGEGEGGLLGVAVSPNYQKTATSMSTTPRRRTTGWRGSSSARTRPRYSLASP